MKTCKMSLAINILLVHCVPQLVHHVLVVGPLPVMNHQLAVAALEQLVLQHSLAHQQPGPPIIQDNIKPLLQLGWVVDIAVELFLCTLSPAPLIRSVWLHIVHPHPLTPGQARQQLGHILCPGRVVFHTVPGPDELAEEGGAAPRPVLQH